MKRELIILIVLLPIIAVAQFSERTIAKANPSMKIVYDTMSNFEHHNKLDEYKMYIGQEFYVLPLIYKDYVSENDLKRFKDLRYKTPRPYLKNELVKNKIKQVLKYRTFYKSNENDENVPYDSVAGKTFIVLNFDEIKSKIITEGYNLLNFTLLEKSSSDTLIWTPSIYEFYYPYSIAIISYVNKIKTKYIGEDFLARSNMTGTNEKPLKPPYYGHLININTGEPIRTAELDNWKCVDLSIIGVYSKPYKEPMLILKNGKGEEIAIFFMKDGKNNATRPSVQIDFITIKEYKMWCEIYGEEYGKLIVLHKVKIGMNSLMCMLSLGIPKDINKTTGSFGVQEQWVYGTNYYLYFENDILKTIQN